MNKAAGMDHFRKKAAERAERRRLWPDPALAPEVPSDAVLAAYAFDRLQHVSKHCWPASKDQSLVTDLRRQISLSENCQAVLMTRELDDLPAKPLDREAIAKLLAELKDPQREADTTNIKPGDVFRTRKQVKIWNRRSFQSSWNFQPTPVVILSQEMTAPWNDRIVRGAACSPVWDEYGADVADDEILVRAEDGSYWIVHLWLEFPVSIGQLHSQMARLDSRACENLDVAVAAFAEGLPLTLEEGAGEPLNPEQDAWLIEERERLYERATWLSATADACFEEWEARMSVAEEDVPFAQLLAFVFGSVAQPLAAASESHVRKIKAMIAGDQTTVELPLITLEGSSPRPRLELPAGFSASIEGLQATLWLLDSTLKKPVKMLACFVGQHYRGKKRFVLEQGVSPSQGLLAALKDKTTVLGLKA